MVVIRLPCQVGDVVFHVEGFVPESFVLNNMYGLLLTFCVVALVAAMFLCASNSIKNAATRRRKFAVVFLVWVVYENVLYIYISLINKWFDNVLFFKILHISGGVVYRMTYLLEYCIPVLTFIVVPLVAFVCVRKNYFDSV
jgi:hypothetical protein